MIMKKDYLGGKKQFLDDSDFAEGQSFDFHSKRSKEHDEGQRFTDMGQPESKNENQ